MLNNIELLSCFLYYFMSDFSFQPSFRGWDACLFGNGLLDASNSNCPLQ